MGEKNVKNDQNKLNEPQVSYERPFHVFNSFEEQQEYELTEMSKLTGEQILQQLRQMINMAYGMHGYDPSKLPNKHFINLIQPDLK